MKYDFFHLCLAFLNITHIFILISTDAYMYYIILYNINYEGI